MKKLLVALALAVGGLLALGAPALAGTPGPDAPVSNFLTVNNTLVLIITGSLVPVVNGLLLRASNPAWVKVLVANLFATGVHAFSQAIQADGTAALSQAWLVGLAVTLVTMTATYLGVWKPVLDPNRTMPTVLPVGSVLAPGT